MNGRKNIFSHNENTVSKRAFHASNSLLFRLAALSFLLMLLGSGCAYTNRLDLPPIDMDKMNKAVSREEKKSAILEAEEQQEKHEPRIKIKDMNPPVEGQENIASQVSEASSTNKPQVAAGAAESAESEGLLLNFDNADIFEVIQVIAGTLNLNYIIDPQVKGVVNIHSGSKIPTNQLYEIFTKILHINGLDIRSEGDYQYIYVAKKLGNERVNGPNKIAGLKDSPQFIIQVVPLAHLSSSEVLKIVEPYLSGQGSLYDLPQQNTLLVSDYESKVMDILRIIARIDISPLASTHIKLVRVDNAPIFDLRDELTEIFTALKINGKDFEGITVVPLERVNSLMLVSNSKSQVQNGVDWIKELDVVPSQDRDNIYIYNVRNSVASGLADLINQLITEEQPATQKGTDKKTTPAATQNKDQKATKSTATKKSTSGSSTSTGSPLSSLRFMGSPVVFGDDDRNVILIRALPGDYIRIVKLLERLDNLPRQVLVEVLVAEIQLTNELELGLEWFLTSNKYAFGTSFSAVGPSTSVTNGVTSTTYPGGFSYSFNYGDVAGFLQTLASRNNLTVLSSPQILVLNNEKALVNVGKQVPIVTTVTENSTTVSQVDKTVQYKDTGVILEVTPQINYNGIILLEVSQTVSKAEENTLSDISSPVISKRELQTKLAVKNGQSILMGGLIDRNTSTTQSGVPFLMDIPFLGNLFKYQKDHEDKTELIMIITPYVIESEDVLDQYSRNFEEKLKQLRPELTKPMASSPREKW
ncbi:MAG: type II secretion system secretin GspD [Proteobacteria bacterium]|nr:type II secretion system secretin GspD [Pseudomonadota bacterium]MBU4298002.1 type II secretion system secretin GspD [Pseudomonadota bacterium]MCG2749562.1 type II secretion system secretin GspD [Desulfobulbaceae bacterium]